MDGYWLRVDGSCCDSFFQKYMTAHIKKSKKKKGEKKRKKNSLTGCVVHSCMVWFWGKRYAHTAFTSVGK